MLNNTYFFHGSSQSFDTPDINKFNMDSLENNTSEFGLYFIFTQMYDFDNIPYSVLQKVRHYAKRDVGNGYIHVFQSNIEFRPKDFLNPEGKIDYKTFEKLFKQCENILISQNTDISELYEKLHSNRKIIKFFVQVTHYFMGMSFESIANLIQKATGKVGFGNFMGLFGTVVLFNPKHFKLFKKYKI